MTRHNDIRMTTKTKTKEKGRKQLNNGEEQCLGTMMLGKRN